MGAFIIPPLERVLAAEDLFSLHGYYELIPENIRDRDQDGLIDREEELYGTDPLLADTDKDGFEDAVEVHELGLSPTSKNEHIFSKNDHDSGVHIRILTMQEGATLIGNSIYLKGVYAHAESEFLLSLQDEKGLAIYERITSDHRGVFSKVVQLDPFCKEDKRQKILLSNGEKLHTFFYLECQVVNYSKLLSHMEFEGLPVQKISSDLVVPEKVVKGFRAQIDERLEAVGYYSSIVTHAQMLLDAEKKTFAALPFQDLGVGAHTFILTLYDRKNNLFYAPFEIPFQIVAPKKPSPYAASLPVGEGAIMLIAFGIGTIGALRHRHVKRRRRNKIFEKDY